MSPTAIRHIYDIMGPNIYEVAKEEAIKLGRMEPDEKPIVQEIGPDGKVIVPTFMTNSWTLCV